MEYKPKISVLMGAFNCAKTLPAAVGAITAQTISDWELIICDDGSADNTYNVMQALAGTDPRIILLRNPKNLGLAPTLNRCLEVANGQYIARMDGDDVCSKERFEKELFFLEHNPKYVLVSSAMEFYDDTGVYGEYVYPLFPNKNDFFKQSPFCHAGCMMRKDVLKELGGYSESESVRRIEDYDLWFRLYKAGYQGANLPDVLYSMYDDKSASARRKFKYRISSFKLLLRSYVTFKPGLKYLPSVIKPIIKGLLPKRIYVYLRKKRLAKRSEK